MAVKSKNTWVLIIFICAGLVIGGLIGQLSAQVDWFSWLAFGQEFGLSQPLVLDLNVLKITFGFTINKTFLSIFHPTNIYLNFSDFSPPSNMGGKNFNICLSSMINNLPLHYKANQQYCHKLEALFSFCITLL